jgi:hypothetical protein
MPSAERVLGIDSRPSFRRGERQVLSIGRAILWVVIAAAVIGLLGRGGISRAEARTADGKIYLRYERIARSGVDTCLHLEFVTPKEQQTQFTIWMNREAFEDTQVIRITPQPVALSLTHDRVFLDIDEPSSGNARHVFIEYQPGTPGMNQLQVGLGDASELRVIQFVHF